MFSDYMGKNALITGAGKRTGIGFGIASRLAARKVNLILTDLGASDHENSPIKLGSLDETEAIAGELSSKYGIRTLALEMDVSKTVSVNQAMSRVKAEFGRLDFVFNNAGTVMGAPNPIHEYDEAGWLKTLDVNLNGVFRVSRAAVPLMVGRPSAIVNIASKAGKSPAPLNGAYSVSKAAVIMLTKVMAMELAEKGIRVNAVCPGLIKTDLQEGNIALKAVLYNTDMTEAEKKLTEAVPLGRMGTIEETADLCIFLASARASFMTGQAVNICGGWLLEC